MSEFLRNEFAAVRVEADSTGNGSVLVVTDLKTLTFSRFDPLELESLVYLNRQQRTILVDPATTRWDSIDDTNSEADAFRWSADASQSSEVSQ